MGVSVFSRDWDLFQLLCTLNGQSRWIDFVLYSVYTWYVTQNFLNSYLFQNFKIQNSKNKNKGYFCRLRLSVALLAGGGV